MSGSEVGSIEYLRSLVDSDSAIAIQCRDALVAKCQSLAEMIDGAAGVDEIKKLEKSLPFSLNEKILEKYCKPKSDRAADELADLTPEDSVEDSDSVLDDIERLVPVDSSAYSQIAQWLNEGAIANGEGLTFKQFLKNEK